MKFFNTTGDEISKYEFVSFYNRVYYYLFRDLELERTIEDILEKDILTTKDVVDILRWKIGTTNFDYQANTVMSRRGLIKVDGLMEKIDEAKKSNGPEDIIKIFRNYDKIGPVYAITFLYFLSNKEYPIYDKFAHIAIKAIKEELPFKSLVQDSELEKEFNTGETDAKKIFKKYKDNYVDRLKNVFDKDYNARDIDRALWAYGHLFKENKTNQNRIEEESL